MQLPLAIAALAAVLALSSAQRFAGPNPNTVDEYDYEDGAAQLPARPQPQPRSYAPNQARLSAASAALPKPTPVPILKQINRHNDDGSYTYGYEGADGSFKIETKLVTGEVMGKYGYVDDSGKVRVVEYGANKFGFQPAGEGITVAPPTLVDETRTPKPSKAAGLGAALNVAGPSLESQEDIYDDGQYYEEPATAAPLRPSPIRTLRPQAAQVPVAAPRPRAQPQYFENTFSAPAAAARPSHIPNNFAQFTQSTSFGLAAPQPLPAPRYTAAPVPARAQIAGAVPAGPAYRPVDPAPVREHHPQPAPAAQPSQQALFVPRSQLPGLSQHYSPSAPAPAPVALPRRPSHASAGGLLDQLARDYALPQNAAQPLVDTSFGVY